MSPGCAGALSTGASSLAAAVDAADHRLARRWGRRRGHVADRVLVGATRAADYSALWLVVAASLWLSGGARARRAAARGLAALLATSAVVNGPVKLAFPRRRPVMRRREVRRALRSSSFPSGHSATSFAFASGVARELPAAAPLLLPLAALVAFSRVYLGVHYPSDVLAGAGIGTAVGLATRTAAMRLPMRGGTR